MMKNILKLAIASVIISCVLGQFGPPPPPNNLSMGPPKGSNNRTHLMLTFADGHTISLPLYPINVRRDAPRDGPPPPNNGTNQQQPPPINGSPNGTRPPPPPQPQPGQAPFTYINNGTHVIITLPNGKNDFYKINLAANRATQDFNTLLNLMLMGQFSQQFESLIANSNLDNEAKLKLKQLGELFLKDPVNFWMNNWLDVAIFVSKLPKDFLAQFQNLIFPVSN